MSTLDSNKYKEAERQSWDRVANNWQKWWKTIERGAEKVLDIATGIGEPAITAANRVGNSGHVLATDISSQRLSLAIQRAVSLGLQDVTRFKEGDVETIDLPSSTFNAVLCRWGLKFLPDLKAGLSNI